MREEGCTYVDVTVPGAEGRWLPVFPAGHVTWQDDIRHRKKPDLPRSAKTVGLGGGEYSAGSAPEIRVPEACDGAADRWQVN